MPYHLPEDADEVIYAYKNYIVLTNGEYPVCIDMNTGKKIWAGRTGPEKKIKWITRYSRLPTYLRFWGDTMLYYEDNFDTSDNYIGRTLTVMKISSGKRVARLFFNSEEKFRFDPYPGFEYPGFNSLQLDSYFLYLFEWKKEIIDSISKKAVHKLLLKKLRIKDLHKMWEEETGFRIYEQNPDEPDTIEDETNYAPKDYVTAIDSNSIYIDCMDTLAALSKNSPGKPEKIYDTIFDGNNTVAQTTDFLIFDNTDDANRINATYSIFDKRNLHAKSLNIDNIYILYNDLKHNSLYVTLYNKKLVKIALPK